MNNDNAGEIHSPLGTTCVADPERRYGSRTQVHQEGYALQPSRWSVAKPECL